MSRIAAAPISWGVCEVPGWGHQLPADRVLDEIRTLGFPALEAGPDGFLPADGKALREKLGELRLVGGFIPLVLHEPGWEEPLTANLTRFTDAGGEVVVLAADTGVDGYDDRPELDAGQWQRLLAAVDEAAERCADAGLRAVLHPHIGTQIEKPDEIARVLDGSRIPLCLDTGHIMGGGGDPVALAIDAPDRIGHVHAKDVRGELAGRVAASGIAYSAAVREGLYCPLGDGDVDFPAIVGALKNYTGWYVLEEDVMLDTDPPAGAGPML
ncbi:MAG TPA: TIM barrel protein, partial [Mycobacteriales bacterium]|nr:TIM barrel protein [Mycobacteriales bacterium]